MAKAKASLKVPTWEELQEKKDSGILTATTPVPTWEELQTQKDQGLLPPPTQTIPSREQAYEELGLTQKEPTWGDVIKHSIIAGVYQTSANINNLLRLIQTGAVKLTDAVTNIFDPDYYDPNKDAILNALKGLQTDIEQTVAYNQEQAQSKEWIKNFIASGLQAVPQIATSAVLGAGIPGSSGAVAKMIPFGALAGSAHARQAELEGGEYWQQVLSGVLGGAAEIATEMPVYKGITKLLQSTGAMKAVNQGAQQLLQTHGQKAVEFLKDLALQSWQEAEMVPLEKAVKQVLGFPQDWSIKPLIKEMGEQAKGGLAMALVMGAIGGGYVGANQVINESIQRQEPPEITIQRVIAEVEESPIQETITEEVSIPETVVEKLPLQEKLVEKAEIPQEKVYYHGSDVNIEKFDISKAKKWNKFGHFFTSDPESAKDYGKVINKAVVKLNNPKVITQKQWWDIRGEHAKDDVWFSNWKKELQEQGYDGLKILSEETQIGKYTVKTPETVVAFEDSQVEVIKEQPIQEKSIEIPEEQKLKPTTQEIPTKKPEEQKLKQPMIEPWQQSLKEYAPETPPEGVSAEDYAYLRQELVNEWQESVREAYELGKPVPKEILNEYPEFVEEIKIKEATKEQEAEIQKELNEYKKQIHKAILRLGGINDKDYEDIPLYLKRKTGRGLDELVLEMQGEGYQVENADDLYALIQESKGIKPVKMSSKEKEIRQKYFKIPSVVGTGELKERGLSVHVRNRIVQKQTEIDFEDQALYQQADFKTMAQKVDQIFSANPEQGLKVAMGEVPPPEGTLAGMYWTAAENQAILNKDTKTLKKLMNSKINEVATALGQNIAAFRERNPLSPIRIVKEINKALETQFAKRKPTITIQEAVKKNAVLLKQDIDKSAPNYDAVVKPNINTWEKFINSITC